MKPWTEDNFLERLMPQLRRESSVQMESCPESELLSDFTEDQVSPLLRDAIAAHLTRCPKCREICERLGHFARATFKPQDAEWINAEKRLDNWMGTFLREGAEKTRSEVRPEHSSARLRWEDILKGVLSWKVGWALGSAAVLVFAVAGVVLTRRGPAVPAPVQIAQTEQVPPLVEKIPAPALSKNSAQANDSAKQSHSELGDSTPSQEAPSGAPAEPANFGKPQATPPSQGSRINSDGTSQGPQTYSPPQPDTYMNGAPAGTRGIPFPPASPASRSLQDKNQSQKQPDQTERPVTQEVSNVTALDKGMTTDQVQDALGKPDKIVNLETKRIYVYKEVYKDLKVIFLSGKVSDVQ